MNTTQKSYIRKKGKKYITKRLENHSSPTGFATNSIADRFHIREILPSIGPLDVYVVTDSIHKTLCGNCGTEDHNNQTDFCNACGFFLKDCSFLLFKGDQLCISGFDPLIQHKLSHHNILKFFDKFYFNDNYYIVAQSVEKQTLADCGSTLDNQGVLDYAISIIDAINYLHQNNLVSADLSLKHIFLNQNQPKLVNFSYSIHSPKVSGHIIFSDLKSFGTSFLTLLSKVKTPNEELKNILIKATHKGYRSAKEIYDSLVKLKKEPVTGRAAEENCFISQKGMSTLVGTASNAGKIRTLNEDSVAALEFTNILQSESRSISLYIIADGMGGHEAGEDASKMAVEYTIKNIIWNFDNSGEMTKPLVRHLLEKAVFHANSKICEISTHKNNNMGTTITTTLLIDNKVYILNIGDTRAYHHSKDKLKLVTEDHSLVYRLYKAGQIKYEDIYNHPDSNQIISALGDPNLEINLANLAKQGNHPYFFDFALKKGDGLFLCSDGLWQMIPDIKIESVLNNHNHPQDAVNQLVAMANQNGGDDNISIIFVKIY